MNYPDTSPTTELLEVRITYRGKLYRNTVAIALGLHQRLEILELALDQAIEPAREGILDDYREKWMVVRPRDDGPADLLEVDPPPNQSRP